MVHYKLVYFDGRGRAEVARLILGNLILTKTIMA
jgi:hypothetical protein